MGQLSDYLAPPLITRLLDEALSAGADFAELYLERSTSSQISLQEEKIYSASASFALGIGIRVIAGSEVGYAYTDVFDDAALLACARAARSVTQQPRVTRPLDLTRRSTYNLYPVNVDPSSVPGAEKAALLLRADAAARSYDQRIREVSGALADSKKEILIANSEGLLVQDTQTMVRLHISALGISTQAERRTGYHGTGGRVDLAHFIQNPPEQIGTEAARMAIAQLQAKSAPAGQQTVVLGPGWSGVLLHEAVGHGLEADFIQKGTSLYAGKFGQQVASPLCTVIDSGLLPHKRGSINIDDEGEPAQETVLIDKGILRDCLRDRLRAKLMGQSSTGSGRRQSYRHAPMPRMTNTYLAPGTTDPQEIISSVSNGLYCATLGGGQVDISNGNFVFDVREAYLIENGRLTHPVKGATLIGVGPETLNRITLVGSDATLDSGMGTCGKDGQSVPVGVGMPTVRIDGITVGGDNAQ